MDLKKIIDAKSFKTMAIATFYHTSGAILGPLLFFGGLGYVLDRKFSSGPLCLIIGVFIAFVTTNILLFKKLGQINRLMASYQTKPGAENKEDSLSAKPIGAASSKISPEVSPTVSPEISSEVSSEISSEENVSLASTKDK